MSENSNRKILIGILICLIIIALKPTSYSDYSDFPDSLDVYNDEGKTVIQLAENRIAIVDTNTNSGTQGEVFVFEFDESKGSFDLISSYDYLEAIYDEE